MTRPLWTDAEVAAVFAHSDLSKYAGMARWRGVGRPRGSKHRNKKALGVAAPSPTSPSVVLSPCLVFAFAKAQEDAGFGDPFEEDWLCSLDALELETMVFFSDLAASALSQGCDASWLGASQETDHIASSRNGAMEEVARHGDDACETFVFKYPSLSSRMEVFEERGQGVVLDVSWH